MEKGEVIILSPVVLIEDLNLADRIFVTLLKMSDDESEDEIYSGNSRSCHSPLLEVSTVDWDDILSKNQVSKSQLNSIIMDYFVVGSFKDAAIEFARESFATSSVDMESISDRELVRNEVINGDCLHAIHLINKICPSILENNQVLLMQLYRQHFVNLLQAGQVQQSIGFAKKYIAPLVLQHPPFLHDIEQMMSLVIYKDVSKECPSHVQHLLSPSTCYEVAEAVNRAILKQRGLCVEPVLVGMMREVVYYQNEMKRKGLTHVPMLQGLE